MMEARDKPVYGDPVRCAEGEFTGWYHWVSDPFESRAGPFYMRRDESGDMVAAFRAEPRHMNGNGAMHGGCLMSFADFALFAIANDALAGDNAVTMNLSGDFLGAARAGALIEARGEVTRGSGKTIFVRGLITADAEPALSFSGIIRRLRRG